MSADIVIGIVVAGVLAVAAFCAPWLWVRKSVQNKGASWYDRLDIENSLRKTNFEVLAGILLFLGAWFAYQQLHAVSQQADAASRKVEIDQQAQVTDRLVKTVQQISSQNQAEQIGGMYGLRSLALDGLRRDDDTYVEVFKQTLCAFIREHAPLQPSQTSHDSVQTAMYLIGDRDRVFAGMSQQSQDRPGGHALLDLGNIDFSGFDLTRLILTDIDFTGSRLFHVDVTGSDFSRSNLHLAGYSEELTPGLMSAVERSKDTNW